MSIENVKSYFGKLGMESKVREFDVSSATVALAAEAIGCEPARIAKSMSFKIGEKAVIIVMAGDARVDNPKFKGFFGTKAKMLTPDELDEMVGHKMGGVCPFAIKEDVNVYLDDSLKRFDTVFPACGSDNSAIELTPAELERYAQNFQCWLDISKLPE